MSDLELLGGFSATPCDKCKGKVALNNDVVALLVLDAGDPIMYGLAVSRHLLPVEDGDTIVCEGSPSRAQYLEGQPRDTRSQYPYRQENETPMRRLYGRLQTVAAALALAGS